MCGEERWVLGRGGGGGGGEGGAQRYGSVFLEVLSWWVRGPNMWGNPVARQAFCALGLEGSDHDSPSPKNPPPQITRTRDAAGEEARYLCDESTYSRALAISLPLE